MTPAERIYRTLRTDVNAFCRAMNFKPTWQQQEILDAVQRGDRRIAVKSGQGPGKTAVSVLVGLWRAFRTSGSRTIVTAPTMRQCKDVWLVEARRLLKNADPWLKELIVPTLSKVVIAGDNDWGVTLITATQPENAQGYHNPNMTFIADEASGIPRPLIEQIKGTLKNQDFLFMMIGNPNTRDCAFFDCFNSQRAAWTTITLNAEQSPEWLVSPASNKAIADEYGTDSDVYRVRVLGEFPNMDPSCIISSEQAEAMTRTDRDELARPEPEVAQARYISIDFARFGGDESVIMRRQGDAIVERRIFAHAEPGHVVEAAFAMQTEAGWSDKETLYIPDASGMGQGVMFKFYDAGKRVFEFHNGGSAIKAREYANRITEAWFALARRFKQGRAYIPNDNTMIQQLSTRLYHVNKKGQLILETKDEYKRRTGNASPDRAETLVMAYYDEVESQVKIGSAA